MLVVLMGKKRASLNPKHGCIDILKTLPSKNKVPIKGQMLR
jgi:hypothetical protein